MRKAVIALLVASACSAAERPGLIRAAERAIALIQRSQESWFHQQQCSSCHHQFLPAIAFREARDRGIDVDEAKAHSDAAKAFAQYADIDRAVQYTHQIDAALDDGYRLLGAEAAGVRPSLVTAIYARHIAVRQQADGHWATIDARPPESYSFITATAVSVRAIDLYHHATLEAETRDRVARARQWLARQRPTCTEERAYKLLGLLWSGGAAGDRKPVTADLMEHQRPDGGWNSVSGRESDAYSTAEALVALYDAGGVSTSDPRWQRGLDYLIQTQAVDGSWHIRSRMMPPVQMSPPYFDTGYPYGHDGFISAMGAAWAVRAMARALGAASSRQVPPLQEAAPRTEAWMETSLFGSAADLRSLLASGFNPNSASAKGTTALMMAVPDIGKVTDLIEHGADINARSKTRYSALLVAALYPNGDASANLLLARGAQTRLPKGEGAPLFNATGIGLAANSGNSKLIPIFAARGEKATEKYTYVGTFVGIPAVAAAQTDDTATMRAMLDAGLAVDTTDDDGLTLLDWGVISNRPNVVRLLLARGADVNHLDAFGMTPLHHAASIDFGNADMIAILQKAGARLDARTKDGVTALDLARKYSHQNLIRPLGGI